LPVQVEGRGDGAAVEVPARVPQGLLRWVAGSAAIQLPSVPVSARFRPPRWTHGAARVFRPHLLFLVAAREFPSLTYRINEWW